MKIRHLVALTGRLPRDPAHQPASGVVGAALSLAACQARAGHAVEAWGWNDGHPAGEALAEGVRLWTSPTWRRARFLRWDLRWLAPVAWHALSRPHQDVMHVHVDPSLLYAPGAGLRLLHLHTPVPDPFPPAYRRALRRAAAVTCCSQYIRRRFLSSSGYRPERTHVVYNGVCLSAYDPGDGRSLPGRPAGGGEAFTVLFAGAIVPQKGVEYLLRAFATVQSLVPRSKLLIAGSARLWSSPDGSPAADEYERQVRRLAQGLDVQFLGNVPRGEMPSVYRAADIVCVPAAWDEPFGMVVCEAMAAGRPVVAAAVGGIPEQVVDGETGFLVPAKDEAALARAIFTLADDADLCARMGEAARQRARLFTWVASARRLLDLYEELLAK